MNKNLIKLLELEILEGLEEEATEEEAPQKESIGSFYVPKAPVTMYSNMMKGLRGLVWPGGKND